MRTLGTPLMTLIVLFGCASTPSGSSRQSGSSVPSASSLMSCDELRNAITEAAAKEEVLQEKLDAGEITADELEKESAQIRAWTTEVGKRAQELKCW